jgi:hypothetical protein
MSRIYSVPFDNVAVSAVQDLVQINGVTGKMLRIVRRWVYSVDVPTAAQQQLGLRERLLPATVTNGSGGSSVTPSKTDLGDAAASFTAFANNTTKATTSGTAVVLGNYGPHIFNGYDDEPDVFYPVAPGEAYVWELEIAPTSAPIHLSGGVSVEEIGG